MNKGTNTSGNAGNHSSHWTCVTESGQWYMDGINGHPMVSTQERVRTILGEAAMNQARRTKQVVMVTISTYELNPDQFVNNTKD